MEQCRAIGFTSNLMCSSCDELDRYNLSKLKKGCQSCCQEDAKEEVDVEVFVMEMELPDNFSIISHNYQQNIQLHILQS